MYVEFAHCSQFTPKGRKDIYDPNFLKSGDYEQPTQGLETLPQALDDGYGSIRKPEQPDNSYGDLNDISVEPSSVANEYLKPGDSLGHDYQNPVALHSEDESDGDHEYHEVDEDKPQKSSDNGYEHPPDLDHEYHEIPDVGGNTATLDGSIKPQFDSPEYMSSALLEKHGSKMALINSNQNNNETEYTTVTDDMLLPPHKRGDTMQSGISSNYQNLQGSDTQL